MCCNADRFARARVLRGLFLSLNLSQRFFMRAKTMFNISSPG
jgi:hypothetical protein